MNCNEIIKQHLCGALSKELAISKLTSIINSERYPETARARYCMSFIERLTQFSNQTITKSELLLSLRDLILFVGKIQVSKQLFDIVDKNGKDYDLINEAGGWVTAKLFLPNWLKEKKFINEVYSFSKEKEEASFSIADEFLKNNTIYKTYKSFEQKAAVYSAINLPQGNTLLVSLPTGSGKSLITQMVSISGNGLTLVIVPTVALALDQFGAAMVNLKEKYKKDIYCYRGNQGTNEYKEIINSLQKKTARLLFTSPEAILRNSKLFEVLHKCASEKYLSNLVVDEAHIVPDWGTFFRPDFQILSFVLKQWRKSSEKTIRTYLLSATLSDDVVSTLYRLYGEANHFFEFRCDALRQEPKFCFVATKTHAEQDEKLIELVKKLPKPMVIYVLEPDEATRIQNLLKDVGFKNIPTFTGKTKDDDRDLVLRNWKKQKYDIVVATSAFGIGVDKPDVRTIIHKCAPENLSRFYQEVGRAGRDGMPSLSVLIPYVGKSDGEGDLSKAFGLVNKRVLRTENIIIRWFSMLRSDKGILDGDIAILDTATPPTTFSDTEIEYAGDRNVSWNVNLLLLLHRTKFIDVQEVFYSNETRSYHFKVKILRLDDMANESTLNEVLEPVRQKELESQLEGYYLIRNLIREPAKQCWGAVFKKLYPLAKECCNGCPYNDDIIISAETSYKIRGNPNIPLVDSNTPMKLIRYSGIYDYFVVRNPGKGSYEIDDAVKAVEKMNDIGLDCLVLPENIASNFRFNKMILTYDEYLSLSSLAPFLFAGGTMCLYGFDDAKNDLIFGRNEDLSKHGYKQVLYCDENMFIKSKNRNLRSFVDCYVKDTNNL